MKQNSRFTHESLQDQNSIRDLLKAISSGINKGKIVLEDEDGTLTMEPEGLLHLKVTASQEEERNRLNIRITWQGEREIPENKSLKIGSK